MVPLFVTDTEVSALLFDFYARVLGYPLEYLIEALAPTPEGDFERLSKQKQRIYRAIQTAHIHGSPDGPWFFIVARTEPGTGLPQLIGITDVSMLRPQVFALGVGQRASGRSPPRNRPSMRSSRSCRASTLMSRPSPIGTGTPGAEAAPTAAPLSIVSSVRTDGWRSTSGISSGAMSPGRRLSRPRAAPAARSDNSRSARPGCPA